MHARWKGRLPVLVLALILLLVSGSLLVLVGSSVVQILTAPECFTAEDVRTDPRCRPQPSGDGVSEADGARKVH